MSDEVKNVPVPIEQICAAIVNKFGTIEMTFEELLSNFNGKAIAIDQDEKNKTLTFKLVDVEQEPAEEKE